MQTILITGASRGIGEALALEYAAPETILAITGRDAARLESVAAACRAKGAEVISFIGDVRERERLAAWIRDLDARTPVSLVIANAGVIAGMTDEHAVEDANAAYELLQINILGAANTVQPLIPRMTERRSGQIALMSSIAAYVPLPLAPSYSASKAAILNYGKSLRDALMPYGVKVSVVCPGYVETRMSLAEKGAKPFIMSAAKAARLIRDGLARNREIVTFPRFFSFVTWLSGLLPSPIRRAVSRPFSFSVRDKSS